MSDWSSVNSHQDFPPSLFLIIEFSVSFILEFGSLEFGTFGFRKWILRFVSHLSSFHISGASHTISKLASLQKSIKIDGQVLL